MSANPPTGSSRRKLDTRDQRYIRNGGGNARDRRRSSRAAGRMYARMKDAFSASQDRADPAVKPPE